ncbi:helix-turn-helix transcriptional regulator [Clostridium malenominatum]|uniref:Helix-turn-helix transcriptional regulator n=1 Tax=Clostridium malenominatum TaxID=1539 RepID=A0ABP3U1A8_9CLOT
MMNLYGAHDHVLILSDIINADFHKHSFLQISISLESSFEIEVLGKHFNCKGIAIDSNTSHRFDGHKNKLLFLLIDNTSTLAKPFKELFCGHHIYTFSNEMVDKISKFVLNNYESIIDNASYIKFLTELLRLLNVEYIYSEPVDQRVIEVIDLLKNCHASEHSVNILANQVSLSKSRLSHLFKENTGITLSGYLVLHKLQNAIYLIFNGMNITKAALTAGFDSPSHLAVTSKRLLGMSAREINKDSVFLKVSPYK